MSERDERKSQERMHVPQSLSLYTYFLLRIIDIHFHHKQAKHEKDECGCGIENTNHARSVSSIYLVVALRFLESTLSNLALGKVYQAHDFPSNPNLHVCQTEKSLD